MSFLITKIYILIAHCCNFTDSLDIARFGMLSVHTYDSGVYLQTSVDKTCDYGP